ncbi:MAG: hypothetical protein ACK41D_11080 [Rubricoccaceae bacterium]
MLFRLLVLPAALLLGFALSLPASAQVQGLGYRLAPQASYVNFSGNAGLTRGPLFGGGVGFSFGEFVELGGSYQLGDQFETDFSRFSGIEDEALAEVLAALGGRAVQVERYGGELKLNLGSGRVVPFLTAGTGLVRFDPDGLAASRNIYLTGGGGLQFSIADRIGLSLMAENFAYRYNPGATFFTPEDLAAAGLAFESFNETTVNNLTARAALAIYLGGRRPGELSDLDRELRRQFEGGLGGLSLVVEPQYGRVQFDDALGLNDLSLAAVEAGFDFGPLVGVRGFYGRGVNPDSPTETEPVALYGGNLRLRLGAGAGVTPFLTLGGGYLQALEGYTDAQGLPVESRPFALGGLGVELPLSARVRLTGEARALAMAAQAGGDVSQPEDVFFSPMLRAGLSLGLGGSRGAVPVVRRADLEAARAEAAAERRAAERERAALEEQIAALRAQSERRQAALDAERARAVALGDTLAVLRIDDEIVRVRTQADAETETLIARRDAARREAPARPDRAAAPDPRFVTLPVPTEGELYVRYGPPGGVQIGEGFEAQAAAPATTPPAARTAVDDATLRRLVREALAEALGTDARALAPAVRAPEQPAAATPATSETQLALLERRLEARLSAELAALRAELRAAQAAAGRPQAPVVVQQQPRPRAPRVVQVAPDGTPQTVAGTPFWSSWSSAGAGPVLGFAFGRGGPAQSVLGLRAEVGSPTLFYLPELYVGLAGRRYLSGGLDAAFAPTLSGLPGDVAPYARAGIGFISRGGDADDGVTFPEPGEEPRGSTFALTLNLGLGASARMGPGDVFADVTTGNFGRYNRLGVGYRFRLGGL